MKPLYLIVHPQIPPYPGWHQPEKKAELERIMQEEDHIIQEDDTSQIPNLPKDRPIMVCGLYKEICVWQVWKTLEEEGYDVSIYEPASYNAP